MAEIGELGEKEMIHELELIEKMQLFTKNEFRNITKKKKTFEYRLKRHTKNKKDVLQYIQFEMDLLKLIHYKRANFQEKGMNQKKREVDYAVANYIHRLFNIAIRRFQSDVKMWLSYIEFCKQVRMYSCASRILDQMLELHGDKPNLFKLAAQWELEECQCVDKARKFLLDGLRTHKESKLLYTEAFKLELNHALAKRKELKEKEEEIPKDDPVLQGKRAEVMYDSAIKKINDVSFVVELYKLSKNYDFTADLQKKILEDLVKLYPKEELTWDTLAKTELECGAENPLDSNLKPTMKERIKSCAKMYETAVEKVNTQTMWQMYLDKMLELNEDSANFPNLKRKCLDTAFQGAHSKGMMTEKYYLTWAEHLRGSDRTGAIYEVLRGGTEKLKGSVTLWKERLRYSLTRGEEEVAERVFREAIAELSDSALPIWKLMLQFYQINSQNKVEELYKKGIQEKCPDIANPLKKMFLEWLTLTRGIMAARKQYSDFCLSPPFNLDLHTKMLELEDKQPLPNLKYIRNCHQNTTNMIGHQNTDVWMAWVRFELNYGDQKMVQEIHRRAMSKLQQPHLVDLFMSEFSLCRALLA